MFLKSQQNKINFPSWIEINLSIIRQNIILLKKNISLQSNFMVMVKANAYGHGLFEISKLSETMGAKFIGVSFINEAITLRQKGIKTPILLFTEPDNTIISELVRFKITPVVYSLEFLKTLSNWLIKNHKKIKIHIKINTGLNRFGFNLNNINKVIMIIKKNKNIITEGLLTHFSCADFDTNTTKTEFNLFKQTLSISNTKELIYQYYTLATVLLQFGIKKPIFN
jgi:alanine racemase